MTAAIAFAARAVSDAKVSGDAPANASALDISSPSFHAVLKSASSPESRANEGDGAGSRSEQRPQTASQPGAKSVSHLVSSSSVAMQALPLPSQSLFPPAPPQGNDLPHRIVASAQPWTSVQVSGTENVHVPASAGFGTSSSARSRNTLSQVGPITAAKAANQGAGAAEEKSTLIAQKVSSESNVALSGLGVAGEAVPNEPSQSMHILDQDSLAAPPQPNKKGELPTRNPAPTSLHVPGIGRQEAVETGQSPAGTVAYFAGGVSTNGLQNGAPSTAVSPEILKAQPKSTPSQSRSAIEAAVAAQQAGSAASTFPPSSIAQPAGDSKPEVGQAAATNGGSALTSQSGHSASESNSHRSDTGGNAGDSSSSQQPANALLAVKTPNAQTADVAAGSVPFHAQSVAVPATSSHSTEAAANVPMAHQAAAQQTLAAGQVQEALSTARLIHSLHDTQMRVGIHSPEFGNISISTSASRDSLSAQISLEHTELAKAITDSIPQIHQTLGPNQRVEIRVAMNAQSGSPLGGGSGGSNGNPQHAWRPAGATRAGPGRIEVRGSNPISIEARAAAIENSDQSRLDVRI